MAKYELPIYGKDDVLIKTYETNHCPWGIFLEAADLSDKLKEMKPLEQITAIGDILKTIFEGLTDAELKKADAGDVFATWAQIQNEASKIKGGKAKN